MLATLAVQTVMVIGADVVRQCIREGLIDEIMVYLALVLLGGGIRWAIGDVSATVDGNLQQTAPGYAEIPPKPPAEK